MSPTGRAFRPAALAKVIVFLAALVPVAMLVRGFLTENLGVNPAETIQLQTGRWALKFLLISLAVTPVRRLTGWNVVIQFRRMLGLFAFFYAVLHFTAYWAFDLTFAFGTMITDVLKRPFIALGFSALVLLVPLAVTSTKGWIRRLGKRWVTLHRLIYAAALLGVIHFYFVTKADDRWPTLALGVWSVAMTLRLAWWLRARRRDGSVGGMKPARRQVVTHIP